MNEVIAVMPTRGLIFSETLESLKLNGIELDNLIIKSGLGIPDAQNWVAKEALKSYTSYVLFVEDDMVVPEGTLQKMIKMDKAIVAVNYPMENGCETVCRSKDEVMWCGLGFTLVKRGVLQSFGDNPFTTSRSYRIESTSPLQLVKQDNPCKYGGHDINFCMRARELGFEIAVLPDVEAKHLRCSNLRRDDTNSGVFEIKPLDKITKYQNY